MWPVTWAMLDALIFNTHYRQLIQASRAYQKGYHTREVSKEIVSNTRGYIITRVTG